MSNTLQDAQSPAKPAGRYDSALRRRGKRAQRERGCWIYIPKEELDKTGYQADAPPFYRVWGSTRGRVVVQLYKEGP